ncbi:hypothetical protein MNAN1_000408 [Malassezia nana]|uniref:Exocyst complex component Sec3 PIP2-binding N-terminal domain-containing protein n=1 Tax=Malassezia nana TaxID=180528 RepID=A0AAF0J2B7_9BASI|nr:hypothetical protein MNAN1_000408 [Malassezia nana]
MSNAFAAALRARVADNEYISHLKVREYEESTQDPATAGSHKTRYILMSASPSQRRAYVYKARRNANGSFSIGKEWDASQACDLRLEPPSWIVITFSRVYRWEVDPAHDPLPFLTNLALVVYKMTKVLPKIRGWSLSPEALADMDDSAAPSAPPPVTREPNVAPPPVAAPAPPAPAPVPLSAAASSTPTATASAPVSRVTVPVALPTPAPDSARAAPVSPLTTVPASTPKPPLLQRKLTRPAAAQPPKVRGTGAEDPVLAQVEEMLEGLEWKGHKAATESREAQVGTADVIEARLLEELAALDASGIHAMMEPDDRVKAVLHGLDDALLQLDRLDASVGGAKMQLLALSEDIAFIEGQNRGLQVQMTNRQVLAQEMDVLLSTITIDRQAMQKMATARLADGAGVAEMEAAAVSLYKSLLQARPDQQAQRSGTEVVAMAQHLAQAEAVARELNARIVSEFQTVLAGALQTQLQDPALLEQATRADASLPSHAHIEQALGRLCGLCMYLKETTPELFEQVTQMYLRGAAHCYATEMQRVFHSASQSWSVSTTRRSAADDRAPGQALQRIFSSLLPRVHAEQAFLVDLLQVNDASFTFADYMDLDPYFRHRAAVTQPLSSQSPYEDMARAVHHVFAAIVPEVDAMAAQARASSPWSVVGLLVEANKAQRAAASQPDGHALADLLGKVCGRLSSELEQHLDEQVRAAERTKVTVKKRGGLLPIVHAFPVLVRRIEAQLGGASDLPVRAVVDRGYERLVRTILAAVQSLPPSEAGDDDKGQLNHAVLLIENAYHLVVRVHPGTPPTPALVHAQDQAQALLERSRGDYVQAVLRRPIGKVIDFGRGVEALLASMPANEVPLHHAYSKNSVKKLIRDHTAKDLRKGIEALSKRVQKHFDDEEPTTSLPGALERDEVSHVLAQVWAACEAQCLAEWERFGRLLRTCYPESQLQPDVSVAEVQRLFQTLPPTLRRR